jgi:hypothetical protein
VVQASIDDSFPRCGPYATPVPLAFLVPRRGAFLERISRFINDYWSEVSALKTCSGSGISVATFRAP